MVGYGSVWIKDSKDFAVIGSNKRIALYDGDVTSLYVPEEELRREWEPVHFQVGQVWEHKKSGRKYTIVLVANKDSDKHKFYLSIGYNYCGQNYICTAASFYKRMEKLHD